MKILIIAQNLHIGGVQKALINMLHVLANNEELEIELFTFAKGVYFDEIPDNINVFSGRLLLQLVATPLDIVINDKNIFQILLRLICMFLVRIIGSKKFYRILFHFQPNCENYDIAISYFNDVPKNYFNQGTNQFVIEHVSANGKIAWFHTDPILAGFDRNECIQTYKHFDKIICVSEACKNKLSDFLPEFQKKISVVNNFIIQDEIKIKSRESVPFKTIDFINIVTVGRVENYQKRIDRIISVCNKLENEGICNYIWRIVGDGPSLKDFSHLVEDLNLSERILFIGSQSNPYPFIYYSDLFVLTSEYEGYPMVVLEALSLETPVLTTKYASANEQILNNKNGIIVGMSVGEIHQAIKNLLLHQEKINNLKRNCQEFTSNNQESLCKFLRIINNI